jgi:galactonate dehydratase
MRIVKVQTIRHTALPHLLWVQIHSDDGLVGLGETYYLPSAVEL